MVVKWYLVPSLEFTMKINLKSHYIIKFFGKKRKKKELLELELRDSKYVI